MNLLETLREILLRLLDVQSRAARIETRLLRLAEVLEINVKEKKHENT